MSIDFGASVVLLLYDSMIIHSTSPIWKTRLFRQIGTEPSRGF